MPQTDEFQYITVRDFTPGIQSRSMRQGVSGSGSVVVPARQGSAQITNTYRCIGLAGGGLAPLPRMIKFWTINSPEPAADVKVVGFFTFGPINVSPVSQFPEEGFLGLEWIGADTFRHFRLIRLKFFTPAFSTDALVTFDSAVASPPPEYWGMSFGVTRMDVTAPDYIAPGIPVVIMEWAEAGFAGYKKVWTFPDPTAPTVSAVTDFLAPNRAGEVVCHQGRVILLEHHVYSHGATGGVPTNEQVSFTDPANSNTAIGSQDSVYMQEFPNGYGAWGSISAGELFLIKQQGGGLIVTGDIFSPVITRLSGVVSTGNFMCRAAATRTGLFYVVNQGGAYSWRGADTAEKISDQLEDDFHENPEAIAFLNVHSVLAEWGDWVLFSNSWLYDLGTKSWWRLDNPSGDFQPRQHYSRSFDNRYMFAAPARMFDSSTPVAYTYDRTLGALNYSYNSQPIPESVDKVLDIVEIVLRVTGRGTVQVTLQGFGGVASDTLTFTYFTASYMQEQRQRISVPGGGSFQASDITYHIVSDGGSDTAPLVESISFGLAELPVPVNPG